ncbi:MAG: hypothetical protein CL389_01340 [Acidiferrobacteraceae bacterium]|nr:hypothetical protein [Acidiferrobacteraceae bacterium]
MSGPLQDPAVSHWTFVPGIKTVQYEVFHHFNLLWSNLRGLGMPILVNDVQVAPLYPLTALLIWLPGEYFWNVFVLARWIVFASGAFLLASRCFRFNLVGSSIFVLTFVFALFHARWINHAFLNGMAAGVWYLYFTLTTLDTSRYKRALRNRIGLLWGLTISTYSVVTCGFPEAAITIALATVLIVPFALFHSMRSHKIFPAQALINIALGNLLGFAIGIPQILALVEMIGLSSSEFRASLALHQFDVGLIDFLLGKVSILGGRPPGPNIHAFGLIPVFLFFYGLRYSIVFRRKKTWGCAALTACGLFYLLKNFPVFGEYFTPIDMLHRLVSSIPLVEQTWLTGYSFPLLLLFFSFFAGHGAHALAEQTSGASPPSRTKENMWVVVLMLLIIIVVNLASENLSNSSYVDILVEHSTAKRIGLLFVVFCLALVIVQFRTKKAVKLKSWIIIVGLTVLEYMVILPNDFLTRTHYWQQHDYSQHSLQVDTMMQRSGIGKHDYRFMDYGNEHIGFFVRAGYSTFRNGAAALYTRRQQTYRNSVLGAAWNGFFPILDVPDQNGWARSSAALQVSSDSAVTMMGWKTLHSDSASRLAGIRLEKHDSLKLDRVGCGVSALGPDGMTDNVFTLDLDLNTYPETYRAIKHIDLVRQNPFGVYRTSDQNFILGVSRNKGTPLLSDAEGFVDIPITTDNIRLWLFACEDGYDQTSSEYTIQISLDRMLNFEKLGPLWPSETTETAQENLLFFDPSALPRAHIPLDCSTSKDEAESLRKITDRGFTIGQAVIEQLAGPSVAVCEKHQSAVQPVGITSDRGRSITLEPVLGPTVLILNDNYYPGWQALDTYSGRDIAIYPANLTFRAMVLPEEKEYQLELRYWPPWLTASLIISLMGMTTLIVLTVLGCRRL